MKLDFPVMLVMMLVAAFLQTILPPLHGGALALKLPLLPFVALYYILDRQRVIALFAALLAGIFTDAASGIPDGTTSFGLLFAALVIFGVRRFFPEASWILPGLLGCAVVLFILLLQYCVLRARANFAVPLYLLFRPLLTIMPASFAASCAIVACARRLELAAGNVEARKEIEEA